VQPIGKSATAGGLREKDANAEMKQAATGGGLLWPRDRHLLRVEPPAYERFAGCRTSTKSIDTVTGGPTIGKAPRLITTQPKAKRAHAPLRRFSTPCPPGAVFMCGQIRFNFDPPECVLAGPPKGRHSIASISGPSITPFGFLDCLYRRRISMHRKPDDMPTCPPVSALYSDMPKVPPPMMVLS